MRVDAERQCLQAHLQSPTIRVQCRTNKRLCKGDDTDAIPFHCARRSFRTPLYVSGLCRPGAVETNMRSSLVLIGFLKPHYPSVKPAPQSYTRAMLQHLSHWLRERPRARGGCQGPSFPQKAPRGRRQGKLPRERSISPLHLAILFQTSGSRPFFSSPKPLTENVRR